MNRLAVAGVVALACSTLGYLLIVVMTLLNQIVPIGVWLAIAVLTFVAAVVFDAATESEPAPQDEE